MIQYCLVFLLSFFLVFHSNSEEVLQSEDYIGDMDSFDGDIGTRVINGQYQTDIRIIQKHTIKTLI